MPATAAPNTKLEYPANPNKSFVSETKFYKQLDKKIYQEYPNATYSIRRKLTYKEVPDALEMFEKKIGQFYGQEKQKLSEHISPERQVYFFGSFYQTSKEEFQKFIVIDAETKARLYGGYSYHKFDNPYEGKN